MLKKTKQNENIVFDALDSYTYCIQSKNHGWMGRNHNNFDEII